MMPNSSTNGPSALHMNEWLLYSLSYNVDQLCIRYTSLWSQLTNDMHYRGFAAHIGRYKTSVLIWACFFSQRDVCFLIKCHIF